MESMQMQNVSVGLRPAVAAWFDAAAERNGIRRSALMRVVLERYAASPQPAVAAMEPFQIRWPQPLASASEQPVDGEGRPQ